MIGLFVCRDLMFCSRVRAVANQLKLQLQFAADLESAQSQITEQPVDYAIVDLSMPGLEIDPWMKQIRAQSSHPMTVIAYAPHVHHETLSAARRAGVDQVYTRGQFNQQMDEILQMVAAPHQA